MESKFSYKIQTINILAAYAASQATDEKEGRYFTARVSRADEPDFEAMMDLKMMPSHKANLAYLATDRARENASYLRFTRENGENSIYMIAPQGVLGKVGAFLPEGIFDGSLAETEYHWCEWGDWGGGPSCMGCNVFLVPYYCSSICWPCSGDFSDKNPAKELVLGELIEFNDEITMPFDELLGGGEPDFRIPALTRAEMNGL
jgi:hypothetical protein